MGKIINLLILGAGLFLQLFVSTEGTLGIDVSQSVTSRSFECLHSQYGYNFAIVRAFRSNGQPDTNAPQTINNARAANIQMVEAYMFPCPKCGNPKAQVQDMLNLGLNVNLIWIDVEIFNWFTDQQRNQEFFQGLVSALENRFPIGVYTNIHNWSTIMGANYTGGSTFGLWYARYDGQPNFHDFRPFGGWKSPTMKQFAQNKSGCKAPAFDVNWRP